MNTNIYIPRPGNAWVGALSSIEALRYGRILKCNAKYEHVETEKISKLTQSLNCEIRDWKRGLIFVALLMTGITRLR